MSKLTTLSVMELSQLLSSRRISSEELTLDYLDNIEKNAHLNAFITVCADKALKDAKQADARFASGEKLHPLAGIPFAVKDNLCTEGVRTTCGSRMLENFVPPYTATAVRKLTEAGGILLGKTNMDEFSMGSASDTSFFGAVKNPLDTQRVAGGSSGGSAAAVSARLAAYSLGSDTGGSVRQPAAFCGVVGMKPTYGAVSRYGLIAFASSLDQIGVISSCVYDNAAVLSLIAAKDCMDTTSRGLAEELIPSQAGTVSGLRVGIPVSDDVSEEVRASVNKAADALRAMGAETVEVSLPHGDVAVAAYYLISAAEASSNLARFDGVRYGYRANGARDVEELFVRSRSEGFGDEVKRRIMLGTFCLSKGEREQYHQKALLARTKLTRELNAIFEKCDIILCPVAPTVAYAVEEKRSAPLDVYREDRFCVLANLASVPALSLPIPLGEGKMTGAVQLMAKANGERLIYEVATALEREVREYEA